MKYLPAFPEKLIQSFEYGEHLSKDGYRGRFAPTPSGDLHLGNLRTALIAWLRARVFSGQFILRIDDLDTPRNKSGSVEKIKNDLLWLGLNWDEPIIFQSKRNHIYEDVIAALRNRKVLYPCSCSRKMLQKERLSSNRPLIYSGKCRKLNQPFPDEIGNGSSLRLKVGTNFASLCGDIILRRSDGIVSYALATVVDELMLGINEVVRGDDLVGEMYSQNAIFDALGQKPVSYRYVPILLNPLGIKLSKRNHDDSLSFYQSQGLNPSQVIGKLAAGLNLVSQNSDLSLLELLSELKNNKSKLLNVFNNVKG